MIKQHLKTKKGATSLFVVIFTIILLGVITLGFSRLMLSDASRTSDNDLSQSAYDAALAGVEDAKIALIKYHKCFKEGGDNSAECNSIKNAMSMGMEKESCDVVANVLNRKSSSSNGETPIRQNTTGNQNSNYIDQAYTCVTIKEKLSDYRSTISSDARTRLVPLKTSNTAGAFVADVKKIVIKWYSSANYNNSTNANLAEDKFKPKNADTANQPPTIGLQFVQNDSEFNLSQLSAANGDSRTDRSTIYLKPSSNTKYQNAIVSTKEMSDSADKSKKTNSNQDPHLVYCKLNNADFACTATINIPNTFKNGSASGTPFFIVSLPYGQPETDFSIQMQKQDGTVVSFNGAQARIDSTGRANELYRRVESRVDLTDVYFPYPEYAIQMSGSGNDGKIEKDFYVTDNCWHSSNSGQGATCQNSHSN